MRRRGTSCSASEIDVSERLRIAARQKRYPRRVRAASPPRRAMDHHTHIGNSSSLYHPTVVLTLQERLRHAAIVGATGSGKSTLLRHIAAQDMARGDGLLLMDAHGDLAEAVLADVPPWRHNHVCYLSAADWEHPVGLNILEDTHPDDRAVAVDGIISAMRAIWAESWGPRMENVLRHASTALIETPNASLILIPRLLTDDTYRKQIVPRVSDPFARAFFDRRYENWRETYRDEVIEPVLNKIEGFLAFPSIRHILGQARSTVHFSHAMRHGRIIVANLASGVVGETAARLFGALLIAQVRAAAMASARAPAEERRPFHVLLDEAQAYGSLSVVNLLSEVRKYATSVVVATQFLDALSDTTRAALLGNAGTLVVFRCAPADAALLAPHFDELHQAFNPVALQSVPVGEAWVNGIPVKIPAPREIGPNDAVKKQSRLHYARRREDVERNMLKALGVCR